MGFSHDPKYVKGKKSLNIIIDTTNNGHFLNKVLRRVNYRPNVLHGWSGVWRNEAVIDRWQAFFIFSCIHFKLSRARFTVTWLLYVLYIIIFVFVTNKSFSVMLIYLLQQTIFKLTYITVSVWLPYYDGSHTGPIITRSVYYWYGSFWFCVHKMCT